MLFRRYTSHILLHARHFAGSDSGCSLGWECIDSADVTEIDSQAKADPLAETPLRDQVFAHCPERLPCKQSACSSTHKLVIPIAHVKLLLYAAASDDGFCLVASEGTLPMAHRLTETPTPTLSSEVSPSKSLLEVPIECSPSPNMHSVEHDTAGITAATAGVAELSLGPHDMMNDQAEASLDTVPVARAESETTMKPSHIPASLPGMQQHAHMHKLHIHAFAALPHTSELCAAITSASESPVHACRWSFRLIRAIFFTIHQF